MERDLVAHLAFFGSALRDRGVPVRLSDEIDGAAALTRLDVCDRDQVRWGLRSAFRIPRRDWDLFDQVFWTCWSTRQPPDNPAVESITELPDPGKLPPRAERREVAPLAEAGEDRSEGEHPGSSPDEQLRRKPFDQCGEDDLAAMERLLRRLPPPPSRRSRHLVPAPHAGALDLRRSFRRAVGTEADLLRPAWRDRAIEQPRLVLLCDTSGSMDPHARFLLTFVLGLRRAVRRLEAFAFNTSLTRLTPWLGPGEIRACLDRLAAGVPDWSGGTRIGECLTTFVDQYLDRLVDRRTDVVILSDGLDCGEPAVLVEAMRALRRRARVVTWLNPLMGDVRYRPEARGMAAALPFVHRFASAHNLESLERAFARPAS